MKEPYKSRVYTDRPAYADFDAPAKFQAIQGGPAGGGAEGKGTVRREAAQPLRGGRAMRTIRTNQNNIKMVLPIRIRE